MSATAGFYHMKINQGATFELTVDYTDADGNAVNIAGYDARMSLRRKVSDTTSLMDLNIGNGRISVSPSVQGRFIISVNATDTSHLPPVEGVYDLEIVDTSNVVTRLLEGTFVVNPEVTR